ncbi:unnamed protein product [Choristocarpus tenellus]
MAESKDIRPAEFRKQVDSNTRAMIESFGALLRQARITDAEGATHESFQINVATANLATTAEGLLRQIRELKLNILLQDKEALDSEVSATCEQISRDKELLKMEMEALSNDLKRAYSEAATRGGSGMRNPSDMR